MSLPNCPKCNESYTYQDGHLLICPMCFHEWTEESLKAEAEAAILRDSVGNEITNDSSGIISQDLKLGSSNIKRGTKISNIRILDEPVNGHELEGKVDGIGSLYLKCSVVKVKG